ncbi:hypothetical protein FQA47_004295 [Oryzias melastigma]|uniref:Uncharacterized protein n=1 Tax=Oryzias melastigma TaxID=30732 RepID=A0A834CJU6_ORYME|nr:hypothetical protein FQA47_004295 [Oryzias melastigma]
MRHEERLFLIPLRLEHADPPLDNSPSSSLDRHTRTEPPAPSSKDKTVSLRAHEGEPGEDAWEEEARRLPSIIKTKEERRGDAGWTHSVEEISATAVIAPLRQEVSNGVSPLSDISARGNPRAPQRTLTDAGKVINGAGGAPAGLRRGSGGALAGLRCVSGPSPVRLHPLWQLWTLALTGGARFSSGGKIPPNPLCSRPL